MGNILGIDDFTLKKEDAESKMYLSYKEYIILNKKITDTDYVNYCLIIYLQKGNELSKCISNINTYIKWLNSNDCKNKLVKCFCDYYNKIIEDKWYEKLEIWKAIITIDKDKYFKSKIICKDDYCKKGENLIFNANGNDFYGMEYKNIKELEI